MVKLATVRECRAYSLGGGSGAASRNRWEYINAGVYVFAAVLLVAGFLAQLLLLAPWIGRAGLVAIAIGLAVLVAIAIGLAAVLAVNAHDLLAHAAGVDYRLGAAAALDAQLALVELAVPAVQIAGTLLMLLAVVFFEIQVSSSICMISDRILSIQGLVTKDLLIRLPSCRWREGTATGWLGTA